MRVKEPIQRLHYMDSLRSVAMFLGLVLHAGVFFAYWPIDPKVPHADASMSIHYLKESIHTFRMELFFLVAGFFFGHAVPLTWSSWVSFEPDSTHCDSIWVMCATYGTLDCSGIFSSKLFQ